MQLFSTTVELYLFYDGPIDMHANMSPCDKLQEVSVESLILKRRLRPMAYCFLINVVPL